MKIRIESDLLGEIEILYEMLYGAQTRRAIENFPVNKEKTIGDFPELIKGIMHCKQAAAIVNQKLGSLSNEKADAIIQASRMVIEENLFNHFPIHYLHGGGGTSANMNANEVLANIAEEILGGKRGEYKLIHPNDHVNLNQSTNDVYPTSCHIAIITKWKEIKPYFNIFVDSLKLRANELKEVLRLSRTCLQDAVITTYGDLLSGYISFMTRSVKRINQSVNSLYKVNLGGSIVGRREDVPENYLKEIIPALIEVTKDPNYVLMENLFDGAQNVDEMVIVSSQLALLANGLIKIADDLRLLSSGPEAGINEITLPVVQPGSSIMPGKVNPIIPEFMIQICIQVLGYNNSCEYALSRGELDLNIYESLIVFNILNSMEMLKTGIEVLDNKCIRDFEVNLKQNESHIKSIIPILTDLTRKHGYATINEICKKAIGEPGKLRQLLRDNGLL